jgi:hypothetical protein
VLRVTRCRRAADSTARRHASMRARITGNQRLRAGLGLARWLRLGCAGRLRGRRSRRPQ